MNNKEKKKITPEIGAGLRDYMPQDMIPRQKMFNTIQKVFESFGFVPIGTPALEIESILTGGDPDFKMNIFKTSVQMGWDKLCLRFDFTVPLARFIAQYQNEIKKPFKRYQVGPVWRAEKPQAGRYREFFQFDADIVGSTSMMADAEIIAIMFETMTALGVKNFLIKVNNRKILNGLSELADFPKERIGEVLRIIDKLDKIKWDGVEEELSELEGKPISKDGISKIKQFIELKDPNKDDLLKKVSSLMEKSATAKEGITELKEVMDCVVSLGIPDNSWTIDLSVARGLGYYTGPVFETILTDLPSIGSVFSGGRYDGLVERFSNVSVPATGASVGVDRLFAALEKLGKLKKQKSISKVLILNFDTKAKFYIQEVATKLRREMVETEIYMGNESSMKAQLTFALNAEIPYVIIAGSSEMEKGTVQLKDLNNKTQTEIKKEEIANELKKNIHIS